MTCGAEAERERKSATQTATGRIAGVDLEVVGHLRALLDRLHDEV